MCEICNLYELLIFQDSKILAVDTFIFLIYPIQRTRLKKVLQTLLLGYVRTFLPNELKNDFLGGIPHVVSFVCYIRKPYQKIKTFGLKLSLNSIFLPTF